MFLTYYGGVDTFCTQCRLVGICKLLLANLLTFPIVLISLSCVMFTVNVSEVINCGREHTSLLSSLSLCETKLFLEGSF